MALTPGGTPYVEASDLVADYPATSLALAEHIDDLQDPAGLEHINTTTFSAVSSVSLNNVFTSTFENYQIVFDVTGSTAAGLAARMRNAGVDDTSATYGHQFISGSTTSVTASSGVTNFFEIGSAITTKGIHVYNVFAPNLAVPTQLLGGWQNFFSASPFVRTVATSHDVSSAFTSISFLPLSGTITGTIRVYGYKNGA